MDKFKNKKLIYIIGGIIILIIIAIILTWKPWKKDKIPYAKNVTANKILNSQVFQPQLSSDGQNFYYYDLDTLNLAKYNLATKATTQLSENMTDQPLLLVWSPDFSQVLISIQNDAYKFSKFGSVFNNPSVPDGTLMLWNYNIATKKYTLLNQNIVNPAPNGGFSPIWSADSKKIIYHYLNVTDNTSTLSISNPDGSKAEIIGNVPEDLYSILSYDENTKILYYATANFETNLSNIYKLNLKTQANEKIYADSQIALPLDNSQIIVGKDKKSAVLNLSNKSEKQLPILISNQSTVSSSKKTLATIILSKDIEEFYIINLESQRITKRIKTNLVNNDFDDINIDSNNNLFFTSNNILYELPY